MADEEKTESKDKKVNTDPNRRIIKGDELKRRKAIPRHDMPHQKPEIRMKNWEEVPLGFTPELAQAEAGRCWDCRIPYCSQGCPVGIDIPAFLRLTEAGDFVGAIRKIKEANALPAICGRVCPKSKQCEMKCVVGKKGTQQPVAIGFTEAFLADYERKNNLMEVPKTAPSTGKKVAIVGAGPASLTAAGDLAKWGHKVVMFEALSKPGGVLRYGIPDFRLPKEIVDVELGMLSKMGVDIRCNHVVGQTITIDELNDEYDAFFIGTGAGLPWFLGLPGENYNGIFSCNEFLTRSILMRARLFPEYDTPLFIGNKVVVIGSGNTAMDSLRTSKRMGAEEVTCVYRRTKAEAPCLPEELEHANEEGVNFKWLTAPLEFYGNEDGWLTGLKCQAMELGEPDDSGRRRPVPIEGKTFDIECDTAIIAIGFSPNPLIPSTTKNLDVNKRGCIVINETGKTSRDGIYAGGDIVTGGTTVINAMGDGKQGAISIHELLTGEKKEM